VSNHAANTTVHITAAERTSWSAAQNATQVSNIASSIAATSASTLFADLTSDYIEADKVLSNLVTVSYTSLVSSAIYAMPEATYNAYGAVTLSQVSQIAVSNLDNRVNVLSTNLSSSLSSDYVSADNVISSTIHDDLITSFTSIVSSAIYAMPAATDSDLGTVTLNQVTAMIFNIASAFVSYGYDGPLAVHHASNSIGQYLLCRGGTIYISNMSFIIPDNTDVGVGGKYTSKTTGSICFYAYKNSGIYYSGCTLNSTVPAAAYTDSGICVILAELSSNYVVRQMQYGDVYRYDKEF
jgi:hypothetical protein